MKQLYDIEIGDLFIRKEELCPSTLPSWLVLDKKNNKVTYLLPSGFICSYAIFEWPILGWHRIR
jgi:hypothetical protein